MSKFSLSTCQCFFRFISLTSVLLLVLAPQSFAEIYTYEQDGVIIISSEPPPRPQKKAKVTKELRTLEKYKKYSRAGVRTERQQTKSNVKRHRVSKRSKSLPTPRDIRRLKKSLSNLSKNTNYLSTYSQLYLKVATSYIHLDSIENSKGLLINN